MAELMYRIINTNLMQVSDPYCYELVLPEHALSANTHMTTRHSFPTVNKAQY
jgi:hypothetical protein